MLFSSLIFLIGFLPLTIGVYFLIPKRCKLRNFFLTIMSLFFYAWGEPRFVLAMIVSIIVNYLFALIIDHQRNNEKNKKIIIAATVLFNLSYLFVFKYLDFAIHTLSVMIGREFTPFGIRLPIGISFFTFQAMSYVFDVGKGEGDVQKNPLNVALYISFFPQLIAGPIVRYNTIAHQIENRRENFDDFCVGIYRFTAGLSKKLLLANNLAIVADRAFDQPLSDLSTSMAWLGILAYTLQIYFDFSGYSDMAIGLGKMFGFHFKENFDYPYLSQSIREFWRRWHISLGSWFRDYVYIPLGGSKRGNMRTALNLIVVWFMTGLWHGANLTFVVWGIYYCVLILIERYILKEGRNNDRSKLVRRSIVFLLVVIGWVFFRSPNLTSAGGYLRIMFAIVPNQLMDRQFILYSREYFLFLVVGFILAGGAVPAFRKQLNKYPKVEYVFTVLLSCAGLLLSIAYLTKGGYNPFIYFNF
jgi:alginate O-acetyltransferase complex protein AlgI